MDGTMNPDQDGKIFVGKSEKPEYLSLPMANRHGLVAGATGTGKTVTLQVLAEGLSRAGVSVFAADIKGDLSGIAAAGEAKEAFVKRAKDMGFDYEPDQFPVMFWDVFGEQGHPVRATVMEIGPLLLSRMLDLNDVQEGLINIAFRYADEDPELTGVEFQRLGRPQGSAQASVLHRRARQGDQHQVRQRRGSEHRRGAAPASGAGKPGRGKISWRTGAETRRFHQDRTGTAAATSTFCLPTS